MDALAKPLGHSVVGEQGVTAGQADLAAVRVPREKEIACKGLMRRK